MCSFYWKYAFILCFLVVVDDNDICFTHHITDFIFTLDSKKYSLGVAFHTYSISRQFFTKTFKSVFRWFRLPRYDIKMHKCWLMFLPMWLRHVQCDVNIIYRYYHVLWYLCARSEIDWRWCAFIEDFIFINFI